MNNIQVTADIKYNRFGFDHIIYVGSKNSMNDLVAEHLNYPRGEYFESIIAKIITLPLPYLSHMSTINRYLSDAIDDSILGMVLIDKISALNGRIIVLTDNDAQSNKIVKFLIENNFDAQSDYLLVHKVVNFCRLSWGYLRSVYQLLMQVSLKSSNQQKTNNADIIQITWVNNPDVTRDSLYREDKYFGPIAFALKNRISFLGKILFNNPNKRPIINKIRDQDNFIDLMDQFYSVKNKTLAVIMAHSIVLKSIWGRYIAGKIDFSGIVRRELLRELVDGRLMRTCLDYYAFKDYFDRVNINKTALYPFENQPWERALILAARKSAFKIKLIGLQFFPFVNGLPIYKKENQLLPDLFLTTDFNSNSLLEAEGAITHFIGSTRNGSLLMSEKLDNFERNTILCCLFLEKVEAIDLAKKAIHISVALNLNLIINYHPLMNPNVLSDITLMSGCCENVKLVEGLAADYFSQSLVILYNSSSICYEAALRGVPIVYVENSMLPDLDRFHRQGKSFSDVNDGISLIRELVTNKDIYYQYANKVYNVANSIMRPLDLTNMENYI